MHSLDTFARSLVRPAPSAPRRRSGHENSMLSWIVSVGCALLPFGVMVQAYLMTA